MSAVPAEVPDVLESSMEVAIATVMYDINVMQLIFCCIGCIGEEGGDKV